MTNNIQKLHNLLIDDGWVKDNHKYKQHFYIKNHHELEIWGDTIHHCDTGGYFKDYDMFSVNVLITILEKRKNNIQKLCTNVSHYQYYKKINIQAIQVTKDTLTKINQHLLDGKCQYRYVYVPQDYKLYHDDDSKGDPLGVIIFGPGMEFIARYGDFISKDQDGKIEVHNQDFFMNNILEQRLEER